MKARGSLAVLVCALAVLSLAPVATAAAGKTAELKLGSFKLGGTNEYEVEVASLQQATKATVASVSVKHDPLRADYEVRAEDAPGIHAAFGALGRLDVSFKRQKKIVEQVEPGCTWIFEQGLFRGSFRFVGEGGYVSAEATDPAGMMVRLPNGFCGFGDDRRARPLLGLTARTLEAKASAGSRVVSFQASQEKFVRKISFSASLHERVEAMNIRRSAAAVGAAGSFTSTGSTRGSVHPPAPFSGSALFRDPGQGPASWIGTLSVSLPGAPDVPLADGSFAARLCPRISILSRCLKSR
jgi:hypothetical protein